MNCINCRNEADNYFDLCDECLDKMASYYENLKVSEQEKEESEKIVNKFLEDY